MSDALQQGYYKIDRFHLSLIGLWPYQSRRERFLRLTLAVLILAMLVPPQTLEIWRRIETDWIWLVQHTEIHILHSYAARGRQFTLTYSVGVYFMMMLYGIRSIVPKTLEFMKLTNETLPKTLIFPVNYYGLDLDTYFYYILASEYIGAMIYCILVIATDTMFMTEVQHACGMFTVVGHQLQRIINDTTDKYAYHSHPKLDLTYQNLIDCIRKHRDVIEFSEIIEATLTWSFFASAAVGLLTISYSGVQTVSLMNINPKWAVRYVAYEILFIVILFFYCFFSQRLADHSQQISDYICQAEWYKTSLATQKLLHQIITRTYVPCQLTAGKLVVSSLENFATMLKTSVSYFTVMRSME